MRAQQLPVQAGGASGSTESVGRMILCLVLFIWLVLLSFFHFVCVSVYDSLWCLKLLFIPLSENVQVYILL